MTATFNPEWALGDGTVPAARYTSREFLALELDKLWPNTWQVACREEEIPNVGDYVEYAYGSETILVVRTAVDTVKAYYNACRHRSTRLASGYGNFSDGQIRCRFHGWCWDLDGANTYVLFPEHFDGAGGMTEQELRLVEVRCDRRWGFVFVCENADGPSLDDYLGVMGPLVDPFAIDRMRFYWYRTAVVGANWKTAVDAFTEAYHAPATHPQLISDQRTQKYEQYEGGHSHYYQDRGRAASFPDDRGSAPDERELLYQSIKAMVEGLDAIFTSRELQIASGIRNREIPEGATAQEEFVKAVYEHADAARIPLPRLSPEQMRHFGILYVFPNLLLLPSYGNTLVYRARPWANEPDRCVFDVWALQMFAEGEVRPLRREVVEPDDDTVWGEVFLQDLRTMPHVTAGLHSRGSRGYRLNPAQEHGIMHMHEAIDRYLQA